MSRSGLFRRQLGILNRCRTRKRVLPQTETRGMLFSKEKYQILLVGLPWMAFFKSNCKTILSCGGYVPLFPTKPQTWRSAFKTVCLSRHHTWHWNCTTAAVQWLVAEPPPVWLQGLFSPCHPRRMFESCDVLQVFDGGGHGTATRPVPEMNEQHGC